MVFLSPLEYLSENVKNSPLNFGFSHSETMIFPFFAYAAQLISVKFLRAGSIKILSSNLKARSTDILNSSLFFAIEIPMLEPRFAGFIMHGKPIFFSTRTAQSSLLPKYLSPVNE